MQDKRFRKNDSGFICQNCKKEVLPLGYTSRNHCPFCLCSLHVDINPGDRANDCGGILRPIQVLPDPKRGNDDLLVNIDTTTTPINSIHNKPSTVNDGVLLSADNIAIHSESALRREQFVVLHRSNSKLRVDLIGQMTSNFCMLIV